jgi:hypothetical protein
MNNKLAFLLILFTFLTSSFASSLRGEANKIHDLSSKSPNMDNETRIVPSEEIAVDGDKLKAFMVAFEDFKNDSSIPDEKKLLQNYIILFSRGRACTYVSFHAKRLESERGLKGGEATLGRDMKYCVSTINYKVTERILSK